MGILDAPAVDVRGNSLRIFDPVRDLPGTIAHFDADTLTGANGSAVTYWQSSFGGFALNRTLTTKPTLLTAAQNGHKAVRFTPSSYLGNSDTFGAGGLGVISGWPLPLTFVFVFRISADWAQSNDAILLGSVGVNVKMTAAGYGINAAAGSDSSKYGQPLNDGQWHIGVVTIGNGGAVVYADGVVCTVSTAAIGTNTMNSIFLGPGQGAAPTAGTIDFGEVIIADRPVSTSRVDIITQALAKKWGLS